MTARSSDEEKEKLLADCEAWAKDYASLNERANQLEDEVGLLRRQSESPAAFPSGDKAAFPTSTFEAGMSLRDWFAGQAISAMLANPGLIVKRTDVLASESYKVADALIAHRMTD